MLTKTYKIAKLSFAEQVRETEKTIRKGQRDLQRDRLQLERQEKKLVSSLSFPYVQQHACETGKLESTSTLKVV